MTNDQQSATKKTNARLPRTIPARLPPLVTLDAESFEMLTVVGVAEMGWAEKKKIGLLEGAVVTTSGSDVELGSGEGKTVGSIVGLREG